MATDLQCSAPFISGHPGLGPGMHGPVQMAGLSRLSASSGALPFEPLRIRGSAAVPSPSTRHFIGDKCLRRFRLSHTTFATPQEDSKQSNIDINVVKDDLHVKTNEFREAWKQLLESFQEEATRMLSVSQDAFETYSKKATIVLEEASQKLRIQGYQTRNDFNKLAREFGEKGKGNLSIAAKNSPEYVKDILETFASSTEELKDVSEINDFHLGIPYGCILVMGGFLQFMLTGSVSAVRFGIILGGALLAMSVSSLRTWRSGSSSTLFLKGQIAIAAILFIREWSVFLQGLSLLSFLTTLICGAMLAFYIYRLIIGGRSNGPNLEQTLE